ncbi:hypothetical protein HZZ00_32340 [Streptomyces sp. NEAU-sy36]|uniref:hypothetical protein n=1 Tax=unclassified Streptomyces TaxID=2593676 RepID=UPI0015D61B10|nr:MULTISPECIES: hypothetical protein [unclassified Streptomyces]QLJ05252.1 hypothetical protein HZZ00_32340 [Streptomyces sp. NEAU-sy36]
MHVNRVWARSAVAAAAGTAILFGTACEGPSALADGDKGSASKSAPNPGFAAFRGKPCPEPTAADRTDGRLITTVVGPEEDVTVRPGGEPRTVLVKLCNTTGTTLRDIALSAQVEWDYAGERKPGLTLERREAPDGDWHPVELRVANDYDPLAGASGAKDLPAHGTRIVEYRISAAEDAPAGRGGFGIHAVRADTDPSDMAGLRSGGHGTFRLVTAPRG